MLNAKTQGRKMAPRTVAVAPGPLPHAFGAPSQSRLTRRIAQLDLATEIGEKEGEAICSARDLS